MTTPLESSKKPNTNDESRAAKILIADDEYSIRFVLREALEAHGHTWPLSKPDAPAAITLLDPTVTCSIYIQP